MIRTAALLAATVSLVLAVPANATPQDDYRIENAHRICATLDAYPTIAGVYGIGMQIVKETGFTEEEAGEMIARAVIGWCPHHEPLMKQLGDPEVEMIR